MIRGALVGMISLLAAGVASEPLAPEPLPPVAAPGPKAGSVDLRGTVHIATRGDRECDPSRWCGTRGRGLALEGLTLELVDPPKGLELEYLCHTQDQGDTGWLPAGSLCGSRGQARRLEGVALRLVGPRASSYSVVYDCHLHLLGDQGWHRDGELCGTRGQARALEALLVLIERRSAPASTPPPAPPSEPDGARPVER
ncbi:MAG: hypothetical protein ACE5IL_16020 [Myxococcota bacterium]